LQSTFTIAWGSVTAGYPLVYDVQIRRPGSGWSMWKTGASKAVGTFVADAGTGTYAFRARQRSLAGGQSGWSPVAGVQVS
jgi:hypothetical protein